MMNERKFLAASTALFIFSLMFSASLALRLAPPVEAYYNGGGGGSAHPYIGGYFSNAEASASKAYFNTYFGPSASRIVTDIISVLSVGGYGGTSNGCPCGYQSLYVLFPNGTVDMSGQIYGYSNSQVVSVALFESHICTVSCNSYGGLIKYSSPNMVFTMFVYPTQASYTQNKPAVYVPVSKSTSDTGLYYGYATVGGKTVEELQFGVESASNQTSNSWYVDQTQIEYYNSGGWGYQAASTTDGKHSWQDLGGTPLAVGGEVLAGIASPGTTTDAAWWSCNTSSCSGSSVSPGTSIWTGTGSVTPYPCNVAGRC